MSGVRTSNLPLVNLPTHVIGVSGSPARTGRLPISTLGALIGASTVVADTKGYLTHAAMLADSATPVGTVARVVADGIANGRYLKTAAPATWLLVEPDQIVIDQTVADTAFSVAGPGQRALRMDDDGLTLGGVRFVGTPGGGIACVTGEGRVIWSHSRFGTNFGGALFVKPDRTVVYRGLALPEDPPPLTGGLMVAGEIALASAYGGEPAASLPIYPTSMFTERESGRQAILSVATTVRAPKRPWSSLSTGGAVQLPYGQARGKVMVSARKLSDLEGDDDTHRWDINYAALQVHNVALPWVWSPKIFPQGDSLSENETVWNMAAYLRHAGATPRMIGTYRTRAEAADQNDFAGGLSEARGGSRLDEHWGITNTTPVGDGEWAAYLAMADRAGTPNKKLKAPLSRPATGGDLAQHVWSGMVLDIRRYLDATGQPDPDVWTINLGTNEYSQLGGSGARALLLEGLPKTVASVRRDLGRIPIIIWTSMAVRSFAGDYAWPDHVMFLQTVIEIYLSMRTGDPAVYLMPGHLMVNEHWGFDVAPAPIDVASGITTTTFSDRIHPRDAMARNFGSALAWMIAHTVPSWPASDAISGTYPTLDLDFGKGVCVVGKAKMPVEWAATRSGSSKRYIDEDGVPRAAPADTVVIDYSDGVGGYIAEGSATNLILDSAAPAHGSSQTLTVSAQPYMGSFIGTGTVTFSGAYAATVGVAAGKIFAEHAFTPAAGSLTMTFAGDVRWAQLEVGSERTSWIPTTSAAATRTADIAPLSAEASALLPVTSGTVRWQGRRVSGISHGLVGTTGGASTNLISSAGGVFTFSPPGGSGSVAINIGTAAEVGACLSYSSAGTTASANGSAAVMNAAAIRAGGVTSVRMSGYASAAAGARIKTRRLTIWPLAADAAAVQAKATTYPIP